MRKWLKDRFKINLSMNIHLLLFCLENISHRKTLWTNILISMVVVRKKHRWSWIFFRLGF